MRKPKRESKGLRLKKRGKYFHVTGTIFGKTTRFSTGTQDLEEAELIKSTYIQQLFEELYMGKRDKLSWLDASALYLKEVVSTKRARTQKEDQRIIQKLDPYLKSLTVDQINMGSLRGYLDDQSKNNIKSATINREMSTLKHILKMAASIWFAKDGNPYLTHVPSIIQIQANDARDPYPISWEEQDALFSFMATHLKRLCLFAVNTGLRQSEICNLRWEWEKQIPELGISVFIIPTGDHKNLDKRWV